MTHQPENPTDQPNVPKYQQRDAEISRLKRAIDGNVLLVRRDGYSRPMFISPMPSYGPFAGPSFPHFMKTCECSRFDDTRPISESETFSKLPYRTIEFRDTGTKDGLGRRIYEEV